ncbi:arsenic resistance N-acetyltransferase ArsN2 [Flavihumibacter fluvii]|uniref:arsenic resistance N-acetyltransferase ArsN2 n=1 Tax=Flavihumibacter fluvii TaxID=2838157 RepID=UPI001BDECAC8|nr:arsenic resistance N-acetyltransferase ArsN2 [Flavihumibacter fluvii]ULQ51814.1 arsenic resistance N-acetyltransferase ArsN2 [Flavihumibacter fluvii]
MDEELFIEPAAAEDFSSVCALLESEQLPISDLRKDMKHFFLAIIGETTVGAIGLDPYGSAGLLRSMIVLPGYRHMGIAAYLVETLETHAKQQAIKELFLITNTAEGFFTKMGFNKISKDQLPVTVASSAEFNGLCPASSSIMKKAM